MFLRYKIINQLVEREVLFFLKSLGIQWKQSCSKLATFCQILLWLLGSTFCRWFSISRLLYAFWTVEMAYFFSSVVTLFMRGVCFDLILFSRLCSGKWIENFRDKILFSPRNIFFALLFHWFLSTFFGANRITWDF